jgi:predicted TIM-barrel fold metal-dependent hydrolase
LPNVAENFHLVQFIKDVYLDSQVTVGLLSNNTSSAVPDVGTSRPPKNITESELGEFLTAPQTASVRDFINKIAGSVRMLAHGQLYPGVGNQRDPVFGDYTQWQIDNLGVDSWKGYTSANSAKLDFDPNSLFQRWTLDDEVVAYPTYEIIMRNKQQLKDHPGFFNICIHKGLSTNAGDDPRLGFPTDIPKAARDWPRLNFIIYHACIRPGFWVLNALNDVRSGRTLEGVPDILWTTKFAVDCAPFKNVYAELGTTFASSVITFPTVCAHILGTLLQFMGEDRVVFGSDAVWYGSPQWQIEALWRFQIPEALRKQYKYPELKESTKRKILGLTSARLYGVKATGELVPGNTPKRGVYHPVPEDYEALIPDDLKRLMEFPGFMADNLSQMRREYLAMGGQRSNTRYGWIRV